MKKIRKLENFINKVNQYTSNGYIDAEEKNAIISNLSKECNLLNKLNIKEEQMLKWIFDRIWDDDLSINGFIKFTASTQKEMWKLAYKNIKIIAHENINMQDKIIEYCDFFNEFANEKITHEGLYNFSKQHTLKFMIANNNDVFSDITPLDIEECFASGKENEIISFWSSREENLNLDIDFSPFKNTFLGDKYFENEENLKAIFSNNNDYENMESFNDENFSILKNIINDKMDKSNMNSKIEILFKEVDGEYFFNLFPNKINTTFKLTNDSNGYLEKIREHFMTKELYEEAKTIIFENIKKIISRSENPIVDNDIIRYFDMNDSLKKQKQIKFGYEEEISFNGEPILKSTPLNEILNGNASLHSNSPISMNDFKHIIKDDKKIFNFDEFNKKTKENIYTLFKFLWKNNKKDFNYFMIEDKTIEDEFSDDTEYVDINQEREFKKYIYEDIKIETLKNQPIHNQRKQNILSESIDTRNNLIQKFKKWGVFFESLTLTEMLEEEKAYISWSDDAKNEIYKWNENTEVYDSKSHIENLLNKIKKEKKKHEKRRVSLWNKNNDINNYNNKIRKNISQGENSWIFTNREYTSLADYKDIIEKLEIQLSLFRQEKQDLEDEEKRMIDAKKKAAIKAKEQELIKKRTLKKAITNKEKELSKLQLNIIENKNED